MLTQVYDGDRLVGLADAAQTPSDPPLTKLEKETLRLWRENQQQAERIATLKEDKARDVEIQHMLQAENQRLKTYIVDKAKTYHFTVDAKEMLGE